VSGTLVVGLAATGAAVVERLRTEGEPVTVIDDRPVGETYEARAEAARAAGAIVVEAPGADAVRKLVETATLVVPSPLVNERHPAIIAARAAGVPVRSEIDLAFERARVPIVAITGTNGKTTVTSLIEAMFLADGRRASAAGNIGRALLAAVDDDVDVLVAEVSSFQLAFCEVFRPRVAVLLAVAPDHLDWHSSFEHYARSKANVFARQGRDDLLVYDADDPEASRLAGGVPHEAASVGVSLDSRSHATFTVRDRALVSPDGRALCSVDALRRGLPHDLSNALAACAAVSSFGVAAPSMQVALENFVTLPHRVALVGEASGVQWYDDSKATNPHASLHAVRSFPSVVLLAGGRNKGLDLTMLAEGAANVRAVVAFGESAPEVEQAFVGKRPVERVTSMHDAVHAAARFARDGDVVLLSPGCASFDAYGSYAQRGDDFASEVNALLEATAS
jgi:UDP-N-acetylmuramoylalanine--D-glutamate ligase